MKIYNYDGVTGEYIGDSKARKNPEVNGEFLIPGNATKKKPPKLDDNEVVVFAEGVWNKVPDFRNIQYYEKATKKPIRLLLGTSPNPGLTTEMPQINSTWSNEEDEWVITPETDEEKRIRLFSDQNVTAHKMLWALWKEVMDNNSNDADAIKLIVDNIDLGD